MALDAPAARAQPPGNASPRYVPKLATPTAELGKLLVFRTAHPLYAAFLLELLGIANREERIQALESMLEMPRPLLRHVRAPKSDEMPPGPLATTRVDPELIQHGLIAAPVDVGEGDDEEDEDFEPDRRFEPSLGDKLRMLFEVTYPGVEDAIIQQVWAAGELLRFGGDFNKYIRSRDLAKQEGIIFRHFLRLILLCGEFANVCPRDADPDQWKGFLNELSARLTESCRSVDPESTDKAIERVAAADVVEGESHAVVANQIAATAEPPVEEEFGAGLL
jgi:hypothetical protein